MTVDALIDCINERLRRRFDFPRRRRVGVRGSDREISVFSPPLRLAYSRFLSPRINSSSVVRSAGRHRARANTSGKCVRGRNGTHYSARLAECNISDMRAAWDT